MRMSILSVLILFISSPVFAEDDFALHENACMTLMIRHYPGGNGALFSGGATGSKLQLFKTEQDGRPHITMIRRLGETKAEVVSFPESEDWDSGRVFQIPVPGEGKSFYARKVPGQDFFQVSPTKEGLCDYIKLRSENPRDKLCDRKGVLKADFRALHITGTKTVLLTQKQKDSITNRVDFLFQQFVNHELSNAQAKADMTAILSGMSRDMDDVRAELNLRINYDEIINHCSKIPGPHMAPKVVQLRDLNNAFKVLRDNSTGAPAIN